MIYLDHAASTPLDPEVFEQMKPLLLDQYGNPSSTHTHGRALRAIIEQSRRTVAECVGAAPSEIFFTGGGTESDNIAIRGAVKAYGIQHVISTQIEHHAVTHSIEYLEKQGRAKAHWLAVSKSGHIDSDELIFQLKKYPSALVSLMHGNNEIGTLHDIQAIGEICASHGAHFHSDTVQTMGHTAYSLKNMPIDYAGASAHKFNGPKGIGFLYVKSGRHIPALILGGGQERNMRAGTENVAFISGMAFALKKCCDNLADRHAHLQQTKAYMKQELLAKIPDVQFNGEADPERSMPTVLNVAPPCGDGDAMLIFSLDLAGVSASGGSACNSGAHLGSHVLTTIGCDTARARNSVRFSFGTQTTKEEIDFAVKALVEIVARA